VRSSGHRLRPKATPSALPYAVLKHPFVSLPENISSLPEDQAQLKSGIGQERESKAILLVPHIGPLGTVRTPETELSEAAQNGLANEGVDLPVDPDLLSIMA